MGKVRGDWEVRGGGEDGEDGEVRLTTLLRPLRLLRPSSPKKEPEHSTERSGSKKSWRRPTLPPSRDGSTIGAAGLNYRVRNGNGCGPCALVASRLCGGAQGAPLAMRASEEARDNRRNGWSTI